MIAKSSIGKVLFFNINTIGAKGSRTSQGNMVLKSKDNSMMVYLGYIGELPQETIDYYMGSPNSIGKYLKKEHETLV